MRQQSLTVAQLDLLLSLVIYGTYDRIPKHNGYDKEVEIRILQQRQLAGRVRQSKNLLDGSADDFEITEKGSTLVDLIKAVSSVKL